MSSIPDTLRAQLETAFGSHQDGEGSAFWQRVLDAAVAAGRTPTDVVAALAEWAANTDSLPADYAIFTAPLGVKLDEPWQLEIDEVFCYVALRRGFDPKQHGVPLDHIGIWNAIGQRMRYNVVRKRRTTRSFVASRHSRSTSPISRSQRTPTTPAIVPRAFVSVAESLRS